MATNNNCEGCGCGPSIPEPCITPPPVCPNPQPCTEITDAQCVKYTGPALTCNDVPIIPTNTSLADALAALVDLTCEDACCTIPAVTSIEDPDYIMLCVDDTALCPYDGLLYNWFAINTATAGNGRVAGGIVNISAVDNPINTWRVPNNNDWQALVTAINPTATFTPWNNIAAGPMKSLTCWSIPNSAANNSTTLAVMPSVYRLDTGLFTPNNGQIGTYWGWDSVATATGYMYSLEFDDDTLFRTVVDKNQGLRLRLVRPAECNEDPGDAIPNAYKDNSGNLYNGIVIGSLVWLTADLKDLKYNNGNVIPVESVNATWAGLATGALCYPLNDTTYEIEYVIGCKQVKISFENFVENLPSGPAGITISVTGGYGIDVTKNVTEKEIEYVIDAKCCEQLNKEVIEIVRIIDNVNKDINDLEKCCATHSEEIAVLQRRPIYEGFFAAGEVFVTNPAWHVQSNPYNTLEFTATETRQHLVTITVNTSEEDPNSRMGMGFGINGSNPVGTVNTNPFVIKYVIGADGTTTHTYILDLTAGDDVVLMFQAITGVVVMDPLWMVVQY
jgi:uncharacterized protein (TIGR02145 family)